MKSRTKLLLASAGLGMGGVCRLACLALAGFVPFGPAVYNQLLVALNSRP